MTELAFWTGIFIFLYTFMGYSLIVWLMAKVIRRTNAYRDDFTPSVSIILSVYNEEAVIKAKMENFLVLDYPSEQIELIIVSDKSDDHTNEIINSFNHRRIKLLVQDERGGKTRALNRGVSAATGEILVFTDANSMFDQEAIRKLVRHFVDPAIGLVSGKSVYLTSDNSQDETGGAYRLYEDFIKEQESRVGSIIGADGAIYALRKSLYEPLKPEFINDFIHSVQAVLKGYRAISETQAICREQVDQCYSGELKRQTRIMTQSWLIFLSQIHKLVIRGKWFYVWSFCSHKFLRWLSIPLLFIVLVLSFMLADEHVFYKSLFIIQVMFWLLAFAGMKMSRGIFRVPFMFMVLHVAAVSGLFQLLSGNLYVSWNPRND